MTMHSFKPASAGRTYDEVSHAISTLNRHGLSLKLDDATRKALEPDTLFDGSDAVFKDVLPGCAVYFEYGMGKSTEWVLGHTQAQVCAVDTNRSWVEKVRRIAADMPDGAGDRLTADWVDVGPLLDWGRPASLAARKSFVDYTDGFWRRDLAPDVVLIDGRFRVCCFLTTLRHAPEGTLILFDDYAQRPNYHVAEEFLPRIDLCGRQAVFEVSAKGKALLTDLELERFRYVLD